MRTALPMFALALGCARPTAEPAVARDQTAASPHDASHIVADTSPSFPVTEDNARFLVASSSVINPPTSVDPMNRVRLADPPPTGCATNDPACGWTYEYGSDQFIATPQPVITNVKGTCFVHAHTGVGTCTPNGKKPISIGTALR